MYNRRRNYSKSYRIYSALVLIVLTAYQFIPPDLLPLQFLALGFVVYFFAIALIDFYNDQREIETRRRQTETDLANKTPSNVYMELAARAFFEIGNVINKFQNLTDDERDDFLFAFPVLLDLKDLVYRDRAYTVKQAQLILFHKLERKHGYYYLPLIHKHKTQQRIWLSALENDLIDLGCAQRDNQTARAYLVETPETCFEKLFFKISDIPFGDTMDDPQ